MEYAYATLLLNESDEEINETNLTEVLEASGCAVEESRVKALVAALEDVDIEDVGPSDIGGETTDQTSQSPDSRDDRDESVSGGGDVDSRTEGENAEVTETESDDESIAET